MIVIVTFALGKHCYATRGVTLSTSAPAGTRNKRLLFLLWTVNTRLSHFPLFRIETGGRVQTMSLGAADGSRRKVTLG